MNTRNLGKRIFTTRKKYSLMILWFLLFSIPNTLLLMARLNGNFHALLFALLLWSPAFYLLADRLRSRLYVYENGLVCQSLFGSKTVRFTPGMQMYIGRIQERLRHECRPPCASAFGTKG